MVKQSYNEQDLITKFDLPCEKFSDFLNNYESGRSIIGYSSLARVIYGYNNPRYLPDTAYLMDYGGGKTVIISSYDTGVAMYQVYTFTDRQQAVTFMADIEHTLYVPIEVILTFITEKIGFWPYKTIVNIINDNYYNIILSVEGRKIELTDDNYEQCVIIMQKTLLLENETVAKAQSAVEYYRNIFKMSRRFVSETTGIPLKTLTAFSSSPSRTIFKTSALNIYKLAQLFGISMEQLLLTECEINPHAREFLEKKDVE